MDRFRPCFILLLLGSLPLRADDLKPTPRERFLNLNGDYHKRAGEFYRREYLPSAIQAMTMAINHQAFTRTEARKVLNTLIDDFLEKYVEGGGTITRLERVQVVRAMDNAVRRIVRDEAAFARYVKWRNNADREANSLSFLMSIEELPFTLSSKLTDAGWTLKTLRVMELEKYAGYFGQIPDTVLLFENPKLSRADRTAWVLVLAFPVERLRDRVANRVGPFRSPDGKQPPIDFFWQSSGMLFFFAEGTFPSAQAQLASAIRSQMLGQPQFGGKSVPID